MQEKKNNFSEVIDKYVDIMKRDFLRQDQIQEKINNPDTVEANVNKLLSG